MVTELFADNTSGTLIAAAPQGTVTLQVNTLTGAFPVPTAGQQFHVAINSGNNTAEVATITGNSSGTWTCSNPLAFNHNAGELVALVVTTAGLATISGGGGGSVNSVTGTAHQISSTGGTTPVLSFPTNGIVLPALSGGHLTTQGGSTLDDGAGNATIGNALVVTTTTTGPSFNSNAHSGTQGFWSDSAKVSGGIQLGRGIGGSSKSTGMLDGPYVGLHSGPEAPTNASAFGTGDFYFGQGTGAIYRWNGSAWILVFQPTTLAQSAPAFQATLTGTGRFVGGGSAAPVSGTYIAGDFIIDFANAQIWVCTTGGTPGTWVPFGASIQPNAGVVTNAGQTLTTATPATLNQFTSGYTAQGVTVTATGFTIVSPGTYIVNANVPCNWTGSSTDDNVQLTLNKNGSSTGMPVSYAAASLTSSGGTNRGSGIINFQTRFAAADTVSISALQSEGISATVLVGATFSVARVSL